MHTVAEGTTNIDFEKIKIFPFFIDIVTIRTIHFFSPFLFSLLLGSFVGDKFQYATKSDLKLMIYLSQHLQIMDYRYVSLLLAIISYLLKQAVSKFIWLSYKFLLLKPLEKYKC